MNIYLSHARKDSALALQLAKRIEGEGVNVLLPETAIAPGENWAKMIGKALDNSDFMVFLLSPGAFEADWVLKDLEYALGSKKFENRVFTVFVGPAVKAGKDMPWILLTLPHSHVESANRFDEVASEIKAQFGASEKRSVHA